MKGSVIPAGADEAAEAPPDGAADFEAAAGLTARPELRLWLRMVTCSTLLAERLRVRLRDGFNVTPARFDLMAQLDTAPEGLSMGELSKRLMVTGGNVTGLADRLVQEGLVVRATIAGDRRTHYLRLTPAGRLAYGAMAEAYQGWLGELLSGLGRDEAAQLMTLLAKFKRSIRTAEPNA